MMAALAHNERAAASDAAINRVAGAGYDVNRNAETLMLWYESLARASNLRIGEAERIHLNRYESLGRKNDEIT
jgi:hypothetical protein